MNKRLWIVLAVLVLAVFGFLLVNKNDNQKESAAKMAYVDQLDANKLITKDEIIKAREKNANRQLTTEEKDQIIEDHYLGKKDAKVVVIEYGDFACSHCQAFHTYAEKIQDDYQDRVLFIFRDFSLNYPNSTATLTAGEAAAKLGGNDAFWKMSKSLFKDETWIGQAVESSQRKELFNQFAKDAGVNVDNFNKLLGDYQNNGIQEKIDRDKAIGQKAGVSGTPTWIVNGVKVDKTTDSAVRQAIDKALSSVGQ